MSLNKTLFSLTEQWKIWFHPGVHCLLRSVRTALDFLSLPILSCVKTLDLLDPNMVEQLNGKNIALVWNSPNLDSTNYWPFIDWNDIVIRLNSGILPEKLSSERTWVKVDIWWFWAINAITHPDVTKEVVNHKNRYSNILVWLSNSTTNSMHAFYKLYAQFIKFRWHRLYFTPEDLYNELVDLVSSWTWEKYNPSTWFLFFYFLYKFIWFKQLSLYWFTFSHEHRILSPGIAWGHNFSRERDVVEWIAKKEPNIRIFV